MAYLGDPLLYLFLFSQCPASTDRAFRQPVGESLLNRERHGCLSTLLGCLTLPAELIEYGSKIQSKSQAKGVRELLSQGERLVAPLQGLVRIAKEPQDISRKGQAKHSGVKSIEHGLMSGHFR